MSDWVSWTILLTLLFLSGLAYIPMLVYLSVKLGMAGYLDAVQQFHRDHYHRKFHRGLDEENQDGESEGS